MSEEQTETKPEEKKAPWTEETFDAERAWNLVQNLREENSGFKAQLGELHESRAKVESLATELETYKAALAEKEAELTQVSATATKERLLTERGLPTNIVSALAGDTEEEWTQMADMLSALHGAKSEGQRVAPDPVQSESKAQPSGDAARLAIANKVFGN